MLLKYDVKQTNQIRLRCRNLIYFIILNRLTNNLASSLLTVALFSLSQLAWSWSVTAEVFGLNNFLIALLIYLTVLFEETDCPNIKLRVSHVDFSIIIQCKFKVLTDELYRQNDIWYE